MPLWNRIELLYKCVNSNSDLEYRIARREAPKQETYFVTFQIPTLDLKHPSEAVFERSASKKLHFALLHVLFVGFVSYLDHFHCCPGSESFFEDASRKYEISGAF
jgi:hypothetical protein